MSIEKSCDSCIYSSFCKTYGKSKECVNFSIHNFTCDYCKHLTPNDKKFCKYEDDDGSMSCCGEVFELDEKYK